MTAFAHIRQSAREFRRLTDRYYWLTAFMIAQNAITRQYKNSFLGVLWTVLQPLMQVIILSIVMPLIMRFPVRNYLVYMVVSYPLWTFFSSALIQAAASITNQAETLKRCVVSSTVFPVADVLKNFYTYLVAAATMYGFSLLFLIPVNPLALLVPLYLLPVLAIIVALSVAIAFIAPYVRDTAELVIVVMNVLFWLTPVIYPLQVVPESLRFWFWLNPFFIMMYPIQELLYVQQIPGPGPTLALLFITALAISVSYTVYRLCRRNYVYYL